MFETLRTLDSAKIFDVLETQKVRQQGSLLPRLLLFDLLASLLFNHFDIDLRNVVVIDKLSQSEPSLGVLTLATFTVPVDQEKVVWDLTIGIHQLLGLLLCWELNFKNGAYLMPLSSRLALTRLLFFLFID